MKRRFVNVHAAGALMVAASSFRACGGSTTDATELEPPASDAPVVANGQVVDVQVLDNSFRPIDLVIEAGTEVVFVNKGRNEHNVLPDEVANDAELVELLANDSSATSWGVTAEDLPPGASYAHLFLVPGTYPYYCSIHGVAGKGMYGVIVVE